jgi:hypothetical protein
LVLSREAQQDTEKPLKFRAEANAGLLQLEKKRVDAFATGKFLFQMRNQVLSREKSTALSGTCPVVQAKMRRTLQKKLKETKNTLDSKPLSGETPCRASNCLPP